MQNDTTADGRRPRCAPTGGRLKGSYSDHDTIFHFSVGSNFIFNPQMRPLTKEELRTEFRLSDERGPYRLVSLTSAISRPSFVFEWRRVRPRPRTSWRFSAEKMDRLFDEGRIDLGRNSLNPRLKQYISDVALTEVGTFFSLSFPP